MHDEIQHKPAYRQHFARTTCDTTGTISGVTDFNFDELDGVERSSPFAESALHLRGVLEYIWKTPDPHAATTRLAAMTALIAPDIFAGGSYRAIGEQVGVSAAMLSSAALDLQDTLGVKFRRSKPTEARETFSKAHKGKWRATG